MRYWLNATETGDKRRNVATKKVCVTVQRTVGKKFCRLNEKARDRSTCNFHCGFLFCCKLRKRSGTLS